jgi:hypothetical protein
MSQTKVELFPKEQIERRAYELYLESGCVDGRDVENWLTAEEELREEYENRESPVKKSATVAAQNGKVQGRLSKSTAK